ncbi:uncharacterized protein EHS24_005069 [Apiotrichum porosum]|uniref:Uncharacterized protein n=1 Tax=Apiotrichum porosum TaxID=105984 RepID=A0A427Y6S9_9TREE|nr:uncharacterized protein EHS24_005069 [Apiotrichum porosum]RSH86797.1 hypothetical protein EHS24_005069 [Apiotrichum porosum]
MADPIPPVQNQIRIHTPESDAPELANGPNGFDRKKFMGAWHVVWSTLPMWKTNKSAQDDAMGR